MTSYFVPGLLIGFLLGASAFGVLALLMLAHRRPPPPTLYRRRYRDAPVDDVVTSSEIGGIQYEHLGMTGEEV